MIGLTIARPQLARSVSVQAKGTKAADFRSMTIEQIDEEVQKCKRELLTLRIKQRTRQVRFSSKMPLKTCALSHQIHFMNDWHCVLFTYGILCDSIDSMER